MEALKPKLILVTGGARSGKSRYALQLSQTFPRKAFVATAVVTDAEMGERIQNHRKERGTEWLTFEEPYEITDIVRKEAANFDLMLVDCMTLWVSNLLLKHKNDNAIKEKITEFKETLTPRSCSFIIVTNEVGSGIVPENPLARKFRDLAGSANQEIAEIADQVFLMVAGIPMELK